MGRVGLDLFFNQMTEELRSLSQEKLNQLPNGQEVASFFNQIVSSNELPVEEKRKHIISMNSIILHYMNRYPSNLNGISNKMDKVVYDMSTIDPILQLYLKYYCFKYRN